MKFKKKIINCGNSIVEFKKKIINCGNSIVEFNKDDSEIE